MINYAIEQVGRLLSWLFLLGMAGCLVAIPIVAYRLFSVLFERDVPGEE